MEPTDAALRVVFSADRSYAEWATVLVAAGLGIELLVVLAESRGKSLFHKFGLAVGTVVILFGVVGEYVFGGRSGDAAAELQRRADTQVAHLGAEAERAKSQIAVANAEAAKARATAAHADAIAAQIKQAAEWRVIPHSLGVILATKLAATSGGQIKLGYPANDPEALYLSLQFARIFNQANRIADKRIWQVQFDPRVFSRFILFGIDIFGTDYTEASFVRSAFSSVGIDAESIPLPNIINDSPGEMISGGIEAPVEIWIGPKKPP